MSILKQYLYFAVWILVINMALNGFFQVVLERPYFYYEYLATPLLFSFIPKTWMRALLLGFILIADAIISIAHIYYFDTVNYLRKIPSLFISHFPWYFWLLVIVGIAIFILALNLFIQSSRVKDIGSSKADKKTYGLFLLACFSILYFFDTLFGFSALNFKPNGNNNINIGKSIVREYYKDMALYIKSYEPVSHFSDFENIHGEKKSIAYHYLLNDTSAHQLLIILESWGLLKDSSLRNQQIQSILDLQQKGYQVKFDSSYFKGGTSQAEARELLNKKGEAYYSIIQNGQLDIEGLPQHKNKQGYYTRALQSFSGVHSSGHWFRTVLGFNTIKEYSNYTTASSSNDNPNHQNNYYNHDNHYLAVNDEIVFEDGFQAASDHSKTFTYILTINTHLPFKSKPASTGKFPTDQTESQYKRLQEQLDHIAYLLHKYPLDKLVIVGDHPPPFLLKPERNLYQEKLVPALIITKK